MLIAAGAVLLLLVGAATMVLNRGLRALASAADQRARLQLAEGLLAGAPMQPILVRADHRLEMPPRIADLFGLVQPPTDFDGLSAAGGGLDPRDAEQLLSDVMTVQRSGKPFVRQVRPRGAARTLMLRGARAPVGTGSSDVVIWVHDASEAQEEVERLAIEQAEVRDAFHALTGLIEAAPLPMWYRGPDLRLSMVNTAYVQAVEGADAADVVARGLELIEGSGQGGPLAGATAARESGRPEVRVLPATIGGARRSMQLYDVPLPGGGVAGFAIDVEELEEARAREQRFAVAQRAMLDRLSAGVAQFGRDRSMVFCNQPFRRMFAMRSEWMADRPEFDRVLERMREANRLPEVRDFPGWKAERRDWFTRTDAATEETWHLPGGVHIRVLAQLLPDGGLLLIFEDRTEEVQLASARDTLLRVRTATFDNLFEALGVFAADGRLQLWNNRFRALWEFEEEFLSSHPRVDAVAEKIAPKLRTPNRATLVTDLVRSATTDRQQRNGRVALADGRHFAFAAVPLPDGNALFTMLDISDSRRAEQALRDRAAALEAANKVKTAFVANMSYELRTPLTSISGFAEMLHAGYAGKLTQQADQYVVAILESVSRLGLLIDEVLDLTQGERDMPLKREMVDLGDIARSAAAAVQGAAGERDIDFAVEIDPSAGQVNGDPRRIRETVEHLLRHAINATVSGGRVLLHVDGEEETARIIVSDDGGGMDEDAARHAFDRFAQPTTTRGVRALDLGLPLAKQFVEAHGGNISLVSELGVGTLVKAELPR
ncbi:PAS-domain containing protein [Sphingomonas sp. IC-11]|uniref:sensor histidine kinase n=1 Tax=Sphingomonas sp. IC-11 TaxID=2898528 RepID=UPI001E614FE1|nr:PAS domain-containing sensor histidine kinase [Sphingomonas sp. IC-11]MCD2315885.1 PAS-domain containing protein [Sphingomonas sp. IC-11]